jgi:hypothetical protein
MKNSMFKMNIMIEMNEEYDEKMWYERKGKEMIKN